MVDAIIETRSAVSCVIIDNDTEKTWDITAKLLPGPEGDLGRIIIVARNITRQVALVAANLWLSLGPCRRCIMAIT
jgi:hypothetical protein